MCINLWQSYYFSAKIQRYPVDFTFIKICDRVTGQHDRQWKILSGQIAILAGHCPLTGRYFQPWLSHTCIKLMYTLGVKVCCGSLYLWLTILYYSDANSLSYITVPKTKENNILNLRFKYQTTTGIFPYQNTAIRSCILTDID